MWHFMILTGHCKSGKQWDVLLATSIGVEKLVSDLNPYNRCTVTQGSSPENSVLSPNKKAQ